MIRYLWKDNRLRFALAVMGHLCSATALLLYPKYVGILTNTIVGDLDAKLLPLLLQCVCVFLGVSACLLFRRITNYRHSTKIRLILSNDLAAKLLSRLRNVSDVTNIYNQEINVVLNDYLMNILNILKLAVSFGLALYFGISISWEIILWILFFTAVSFLFNHLFAKKLATLATKLQESNIAINAALNGVFNAIRTVNIYAAKGLAFGKLNRAFEDRRIAGVNNAGFNAWVNELNNFLGYLTQYGLIIGAFILVRYERIGIGEVVTLQLLMQHLTSPMFELMWIKNAMDATKEIRAKLKAILDEPDQSVTATLPNGDIVFDNVAFAYGEESFMSDINLAFEQGKRYLIVGKSGSGKSTLLKLILKELSIKSGSITYDGASIDDYNNPTWYQNIAYAGQKVELIPGTLRENIVLDYAYDESKFNNIIKMVNLEYLSDKLDQPLTEDMSNFSGGELQRIAVARMLYKDSSILLFDEFSSALDNMNAFQIESDLLRIQDKTMLSVTHRIHPGLLEHYDKVIMMEDGKIKHTGSAEELAEALSPFIGEAVA